jgi:cardiolipin synthase A/B
VTGRLVATIDEIARRLPAGQVAALATAVEPFDALTPEARSAAIAAVPMPTVRDLAERLVDAWKEDDAFSGAALALAMTAAREAVDRTRSEESIEVVWTGPNTGAVPVRLTREVLIDVIRSARESLIVVSFAAYRVEVVLEELSEAVERGVVVRLILETGETAGGTLAFDAAHAFRSVRGVSFYAWPTEKRPVLEKGRASLHAKAAIADDHTAFVTSANLTGHGIGKNMELGLLVKGGPIPRRLSQHFRDLIASGVLVEVLG